MLIRKDVVKAFLKKCSKASQNLNSCKVGVQDFLIEIGHLGVKKILFQAFLDALSSFDFKLSLGQ